MEQYAWSMTGRSITSRWTSPKDPGLDGENPAAPGPDRHILLQGS